jgi:hypothetical protein
MLSKRASQLHGVMSLGRLATQRRWRWALLAAAGVAAAAVLLLAGVRPASRSAADPDPAARTVAVTYTHARLTHDYSTWWESVAPACRPASTKSEWVTQIRAGYERLGTQGAPAGTRVKVVRLTSEGDALRMEVRVTSPTGTRTGNLEVDVQHVQGGWRVVGYGTPGDADRCGVW